MHSDLLEFVRRRLESSKGTWPAIAEATGVPYDTITKIAQGTIEDPGVSKVQKLANYFRQQWA